MTKDTPIAVRQAASAALLLGRERLVASCEVTFFTAGGPGGQHRNKSATAVRIHHPGTGVTVQATERRSQAQNRSCATERLWQEMQYLTYIPKERVATQVPVEATVNRVDAKRHASAKKRARRGW